MKHHRPHKDRRRNAAVLATMGLAMVLGAAGRVRAAGVVFDGGAPLQGAAGGECTGSVQAADFTLDATTMVTGARFWTSEFSNPWDGTVEYFIFPDVGGVPATAPTYSGFGQSIIRLGPLGPQFLGADWYSYEIQLTAPLSLSAGTYWLGLHLHADYSHDYGIHWGATPSRFGAPPQVSAGGTFNNWFPATAGDVDWAFQLLGPCGDGDLDAGEQCDDGNNADGDCCSHNCQYESNGSSCDDSTVCNGNETCDGAGTCQPGTPLDCDDHNACSADSCDPLAGCVNDDSPSVDCLPARSLVLIRKSNDDTKDKLLWKWTRGAALDQMDLADPITSDAYGLCVYAGPTSTLIADATIPPGASWTEVGTKGYKFKGTSPNGLSLALLKGGAGGKSKALVKGKGAALPDPTLPVVYPVTVQLKKDGSPLCLESTFTAADEVKNDAGQFKAKQ